MGLRRGARTLERIRTSPHSEYLYAKDSKFDRYVHGYELTLSLSPFVIVVIMWLDKNENQVELVFSPHVIHYPLPTPLVTHRSIDPVSMRQTKLGLVTVKRESLTRSVSLVREQHMLKKKRKRKSEERKN